MPASERCSVYRIDRYWADSSGRRNTLTSEVLMATERRKSKRSTWFKLSSPGRPPVWQRENLCRFWREIAAGLSTEEVAVEAGVSAPVEPVTAPAAIKSLFDSGHVRPILPRALRCQCRIMFNSLEGMIRRWCDPRNPADRPDTKDATVIVEKRDHLRNGRSSSAAAKYALAFFRNSLAWRSFRTSRSISLIRSFSGLVSPPRCPASRSACWHQTRRLSGGTAKLRRVRLIGGCVAGVGGAALSEKPNTALAQFGRIGGGESLLRHRVHPLSVLLSGKLGAVQC